MLEDLKPKEAVRACKVRTIIDSLSSVDQKILLDALDNPLWGDLPLASALNERGVEVSNMSIRKHRRQQCSCRKLNDA